MGHDFHPDPELGQARRLRGSGAWGGVIEEMAPAWVQQRTMSPRDPPLPSREGERVWDGIDTTATDEHQEPR